ncbi:hypothetical protein N0V88_007829 [Collariella sp. IMI 366227]|nr:hypothetical protein N0V88_007829 [Collariella sp. IMI 366227]
MRSFIAPALLALAASVAAIKITSPSKNDVVDPSAGVTVKWTTVSSDPKKAHLMLVNMASGHTPFNKDLGEVDLSKGSITITEKNVPADEAYQFNFQSVDENNTGILAQSEQFEIKASDETDEDDKTTSDAATTTTSAPPKTSATTLTVTDEEGETTTITSATTFATVSTTGTATTEETGSSTAAASSTASTGAAATAMAVQGGSLLALFAGVAALMA